MLTLPVTLTRWIVRFAPLLSKRVWEHAQVLLVGALLAPGKRTVTAVLRVLGLEQEPHFQTYHRVLNRARWSSLAVARGVIGLGGGDVRRHRASGDWDRRYRGTAARGEDQSQRDLSGSGALLAFAYGQSQWPALAVCDGVGGDSLGGPGVGLTVSHGVMSLRAVSPAAGSSVTRRYQSGRGN